MTKLDIFGLLYQTTLVLWLLGSVASNCPRCSDVQPSGGDDSLRRPGLAVPPETGTGEWSVQLSPSFRHNGRQKRSRGSIIYGSASRSYRENPQPREHRSPVRGRGYGRGRSNPYRPRKVVTRDEVQRRRSQVRPDPLDQKKSLQRRQERLRQLRQMRLQARTPKRSRGGTPSLTPKEPRYVSQESQRRLRNLNPPSTTTSSSPKLANLQLSTFDEYSDHSAGYRGPSFSSRRSRGPSPPDTGYGLIAAVSQVYKTHRTAEIAKARRPVVRNNDVESQPTTTARPDHNPTTEKLEKTTHTDTTPVYKGEQGKFDIFNVYSKTTDDQGGVLLTGRTTINPFIEPTTALDYLSSYDSRPLAKYRPINVILSKDIKASILPSAPDSTLELQKTVPATSGYYKITQQSHTGFISRHSDEESTSHAVSSTPRKLSSSDVSSSAIPAGTKDPPTVITPVERATTNLNTIRPTEPAGMTTQPSVEVSKDNDDGGKLSVPDRERRERLRRLRQWKLRRQQRLRRKQQTTTERLPSTESELTLDSRKTTPSAEMSSSKSVAANHRPRIQFESVSQINYRLEPSDELSEKIKISTDGSDDSDSSIAGISTPSNEASLSGVAMTTVYSYDFDRQVPSEEMTRYESESPDIKDSEGMGSGDVPDQTTEAGAAVNTRPYVLNGVDRKGINDPKQGVDKNTTTQVESPEKKKRRPSTRRRGQDYETLGRRWSLSQDAWDNRNASSTGSSVNKRRRGGRRPPKRRRKYGRRRKAGASLTTEAPVSANKNDVTTKPPISRKPPKNSSARKWRRRMRRRRRRRNRRKNKNKKPNRRRGSMATASNSRTINTSGESDDSGSRGEKEEPKSPFVGYKTAYDFLSSQKGSRGHVTNEARRENNDFSRYMGEGMCEVFKKHYVATRIGGKCV